jgi:hypothetical protein
MTVQGWQVVPVLLENVGCFAWVEQLTRVLIGHFSREGEGKPEPAMFLDGYFGPDGFLQQRQITRWVYDHAATTPRRKRLVMVVFSHLATQGFHS